MCIYVLYILLLLTQRATSGHELPGTTHNIFHLTLQSCSSGHLALRPLFTCCILGFLQPFRLFLPHLRWPPELSTGYTTCKARAALLLPCCCCATKTLAEGAPSSATALGERGRQGDSSGGSRSMANMSHWPGKTVRFTLALYREKAAEAHPPVDKCNNKGSTGQMPLVFFPRQD